VSPARRGGKSVTYVALVRGINVGRAKRVAMSDLRAIVEALGYQDVRTVLNSGNIVFAAGGGAPANPAARIEQALADRLGVAARVTVLTDADVAAIVAANPLSDVATDPSRLQVGVLFSASDRAKLHPLARENWKRERIALGARAAYLWCPDGTIKSRLAQAVFRALGDAVTTRNWATMEKLHAIASAPKR
jgi:uncharacterized protein (DUF1697 family)